MSQNIKKNSQSHVAWISSWNLIHQIKWNVFHKIFLHQKKRENFSFLYILVLVRVKPMKQLQNPTKLFTGFIIAVWFLEENFFCSKKLSVKFWLFYISSVVSEKNGIFPSFSHFTLFIYQCVSEMNIFLKILPRLHTTFHGKFPIFSFSSSLYFYIFVVVVWISIYIVLISQFIQQVVYKCPSN